MKINVVGCGGKECLFIRCEESAANGDLGWSSRFIVSWSLFRVSEERACEDSDTLKRELQRKSAERRVAGALPALRMPRNLQSRSRFTIKWNCSGAFAEDCDAPPATQAG